MTPLSWPELLNPAQGPVLADLLLAYARPRRWFRAKAREPRGASIVDLVPLDPANVLVLVGIDFATGERELYAIPVGRVEHETPAAAGAMGPTGAIAPLGATGGKGTLVDGLLVPGMAADLLLKVIRDGRTLRGARDGQLRGEPMPQLAALAAGELAVGTLPRVEQTNSVAIFGERVLLKIYRQLTAGPNPELEVGAFLTRRCNPACAPRVLGALTYRGADGEEFSLAIAHEYLANEGDAFTFIQAELRTFLEHRTAPPTPGVAPGMERFLALATTLGRRTGELHLALAAADPDDADFAPQPLAASDRARLVARTEAMLTQQLQALSSALTGLPSATRALAERLLQPEARQSISMRLAAFRDRPIEVVKTRTHGDLHLGQVLVRGNDVVIIDFEGEPGRPLSERRDRSSPLRDVMGMVRSFDYAPEVLLRERPAGGGEHQGSWAALWKREMTDAYLNSYLTTVNGASFIPPTHEDLALLLTFYELEKVIYEIGYEVNNRPDWVEIPLRGLAAIAAVTVPGAIG